MTDFSFLLLIIVIIILLLMVSAFFSGSETALTATSEARMRSLAQRGSKRAKTIEKLLRQKDRLISSLLIGNNLVNVISTSLATSVAIAVFGEGGIILTSLVMTILLVVFAEVLPKTYAVNNADRFALRVVKIVHVIVLLLTPLSMGLNLLIRLIVKPPLLGDDEREEELRGMIELHGANTLDADTKETSVMLSGILDLGEVTVDEVMTHRGSVAMIDAATSPRDVMQQVMLSPFTRHPIYSGDVENIIGVLHVKALLRGIGGDVNAAVINIADLAAEPYFVPETTLLIDQLKSFRNRNEHFALVVDEYGDFRGIVTLEDILEEVVGEIDDEHDVSLSGLALQDDGSYIVDGHVTIRDLNRALEWRLPDDDATTIAGLILNETRTIPVPGQAFRFHQKRFHILKRTNNKIDLIQIWHEPQTASEKSP